MGFAVPSSSLVAYLKNDATSRKAAKPIPRTYASFDVKTTWYAGRYWYEALMRSGIRVYEYQPSMLHSKTIVVDGLWSSVGSMNFDNRSMAFNNESNLVVLDRAFGAQMDSVFLDDLRYATEMSLNAFSRRSTWQKLLERGAMLFSRLL